MIAKEATSAERFDESRRMPNIKTMLIEKNRFGYEYFEV